MARNYANLRHPANSNPLIGSGPEVDPVFCTRVTGCICKGLERLLGLRFFAFASPAGEAKNCPIHAARPSLAQCRNHTFRTPIVQRGLFLVRLVFRFVPCTPYTSAGVRLSKL